MARKLYPIPGCTGYFSHLSTSTASGSQSILIQSTEDWHNLNGTIWRLGQVRGGQRYRNTLVESLMRTGMVIVSHIVFQNPLQMPVLAFPTSLKPCAPLLNFLIALPLNSTFSENGLALILNIHEGSKGNQDAGHLSM